MSILVLGLGNLLMRDDGFGVKAIAELSSRYLFSERVRLLDGGTLGLDLLPHLEGVERLLIIDALSMNGIPGQVFRLEGEAVPRAFASRLSVHQMGIQDMLAVAELQGHLPKTLVVLGVQPRSVAMGVDLSPDVAAAMPGVLEKVLVELRHWGEPVQQVA